jgi:hypothetical protein
MSVLSGRVPTYLTIPLLILPPGLENFITLPLQMSSGFIGTNGRFCASIESFELQFQKLIQINNN